MWLVYLRFDDQGKTRTYHVRTSSKAAVNVAGSAAKVGLVCCNGWFGLSVVRRASPDYVAPPPSTMRSTTLPRTGLC
jgi:hypothetical protein